MVTRNPLHDAEARTITHLEYIGYTVDPEAEPQGWRLAESPLAPPLSFRVSKRLLFLYAEYAAGRYDPESYLRLLEEINRLNAANWLLRTAVVRKHDGDGDRCSLRLQAQLPTDLATSELGSYLFAWIRETTHVERLARACSAAGVEPPGEAQPHAGG